MKPIEKIAIECCDANREFLFRWVASDGAFIQLSPASVLLVLDALQERSARLQRRRGLARVWKWRCK